MERTRCNQTSPETGDGWRDETGTGSKTRKGPRRPKSPFAGRVQMERLSPLQSAKNAGGRRGPWGQRGISSTGIPETTPARQVSGWTRDRDVDTDPPGTRPAGPGAANRPRTYRRRRRFRKETPQRGFRTYLLWKMLAVPGGGNSIKYRRCRRLVTAAEGPRCCFATVKVCYLQR